MAKITVLMPVAHGAEYLEETLQSVQEQTFSDWLLLAVCAADLDDVNMGSLHGFEEKDSRVRIVMAEPGQNIAEMLNLGYEKAQGDFIARAEVGTIFASERLEKQVAFLEAHPEISLCSSSLKQGDSLRKAICDAEELKAAMLFGSEINHQSVMLRKSDFDRLGLRYNPAWSSEYELWARAMREGLGLANLPESLVTCLPSSRGGLSMADRERLHGEMRQIVMENVAALGVETGEYSPTLFAGWRNRPEGFAKKHPVNFMRRGYMLLQAIEAANAEKKIFSPQALKKVLYKRWDWIRQSCGLDFVAGQYGKFPPVDNQKVSIVMPVGKCASTLSRAIDSIQAQTCQEWELFLVEMAGAEDGSCEIAAMYGENDPRISWLPMDGERNEAGALNAGFEKALGRYVALMEADAAVATDRLERQVAFLESHQETGVCGGWLNIEDEHGERTLKTPVDTELLKARLIFYADMNFPTLMMRRELLAGGLACDAEAQDWRYGFLARASLAAGVTNIPAILGTAGSLPDKPQDVELAAKESSRIVGEILEKSLAISLPESSRVLLQDWKSPLDGEHGWKQEQELSRLSKILERIYQANEEMQIYAPKALLDVLARKWCQVHYGMDWQALDTSAIESLEEIFATEFKPAISMPYHIFRKEAEGQERKVPKVAALMPLFNGKKYIRESIESIQAQTFTDWEFYIVNDFGSDDGCAEIVKEYAQADERIILVQAERRLGLAASLNLGLELIESEYVARVDVDDPSEPERFEKELAYLDEHPETSLVSCWQWSLTTNRSYVQEVAYEPEELKAAMMFGCEISHCGVMLRKADFDAHGWRYDPSYLGEDYELWTRALMEGAVMANLPEPLVTHRWGFGNISLDKGKKLRDEVRILSKRYVSNLGVDVEKYDQALFASWRNTQQGYFSKRKGFFLKQCYDLLMNIENHNKSVRFIQPASLHKILSQRWDWVRKSCSLKFSDSGMKVEHAENNATPMVSVVLPTFCYVNEISRAIDSIQAQTFKDWELLVVNDFGSDDGMVELVKMYAWTDKRVHLIQAEKKIGHAESLNLGIKKARGKYIAQYDVYDISVPDRFAKQVAYLEGNPQVGIVGGWQHLYGKKEWIHESAPEPELQRCRLLFWCDLCKSTLMLRRKVLIENDLFYDSNIQAEDWELWTRVMQYTDIANIPEILGDYKDNVNLTVEEIADLSDESGQIVARTLQRTLGLRLSLYEYHLLNDWQNPVAKAHYEDELPKVKKVLRKIWERNEDVGFFNPKYLLQTLAGKYFWIKDNRDWKQENYSYVHSIEDIFREDYIPTYMPEIPLWAARLRDELDKKIEAWTWERYERIRRQLLPEIDKSVEKWTWNRYQSMEKKLLPKFEKAVEQWTWERYQRNRLDTRGIAAQVPYYPELQIRVVFLFQVASFWPAQEPLYRELVADSRFSVKLVCYDERIDRSIKVETARKYLEKNEYDFMPWENFDIEDYNPHVVFLQTAYDSNRRPEFKSKNLAANGFRPVYIPYGIEISDTQAAHCDHFRYQITEFAWKIFTFSEIMRNDYLRHMRFRTDVVALGLPRFDALYNSTRFVMYKEVHNKAQGRKIILWKVHFPKVIKEKDRTILVTPDIQGYIEFAHLMEEMYSDIFFIFMPHPRFYEFNDDEKVRSEIRELMSIISEKSNVYIDEADDYRPSLLNADAIIVDRSAVMIEAAVVDVPVLYMSNADFYEPMTEAVRPLVESYEQGTSCQDMVEFVERVRQGIDKNKEQRNQAFKQCIPFFDGKCSERIKEDIVASLEAERAEGAPVRCK